MTDQERRYLLVRLALMLVCAATTLYWAIILVDWTPGAAPVADPDLAPVVFVPATTTPPTTTEPPTPAQITPLTTATTSTTTTVPAGVWQCPEAVAAATTVGWPSAELETLDRTVWRESRCIPTVTNMAGRDESFGLLQINTKGGLWEHRRQLCGLTGPEELLSPTVNLRCALALWELSGWAPWGGGA